MGPAVKLYAQWKPITAQIIDSNDTSAVREYISLADAVAEYDGNGYIKMTANTKESGFVLKRNVYLDLNGCTVKLTSPLDTTRGNLYGMDTSVTDYEGTPAGKLVLTAGGAPASKTEKDGNKYVALSDASGYSFHRCNLYISGYRYELNRGAKNGELNGEGALFFQATLQGNTTLQNAVKAFSFTIAGKTVAKDKKGTPVAMNDGKFEGYWYTKKVNLYMDEDISAVANVTVNTALFSSAEVTLNFNDAMSNAAPA